MGKDYGTTAEGMALEYAFRQMKMNAVLADALLKNQRSQHVLEKVGFVEARRDDAFCYYRCGQDHWKGFCST